LKAGVLKEILDELHDRFNRIDFIINDPISIPHKFNRKEDIEISGFFSAILAWGQRSQIIKSAGFLMQLMDLAPYDFIRYASPGDLNRLEKFYYRTFQSIDALFFVQALREIYLNGGLEELFTSAYRAKGEIKDGIIELYKSFLSVPHLNRSMKHIARVESGSSAKRLNLFLRWMVRNDNRGVDFGLWKDIPSSALYIPLDVHSGRTARTLGLLNRKQNDWKAVQELTYTLKQFDPVDPVKYDFALFGAGVEGFNLRNR
jgi:uncharacterized protein (TIGR02757 family)